MFIRLTTHIPDDMKEQIKKKLPINVNITKIAFFGTSAENTTTIVSMDDGNRFEVTESERVIRGLIEDIL